MPEPRTTSDSASLPVEVAVVVVTFDSPAGMLEECVRSLVAAAPPGIPVQLVVVDTGGRARRRLSVTAPEVLGAITLLETANAGFGAAANVGFRAALASGAAAVACMNDDVVVEAGWLESLLAALDSDSRIGGVQPVLARLGTDPAAIDGAGVGIDRFGAGSDLRRGEAVSTLGPVEDVPAITGGAALFRRSFLDDVGGFDERFFLYYEDVELCRRGRRRGWTFRVVPTSRVWHVGSASTGRLGDHRLLLQERNRLWSSAMHGTAREILEAWGLSLRRLRHEPRRTHRRALRAGTVGGLGRLAARVLRRPPVWPLDAARPTTVHRDPFASRPVDGVNVVGYLHVSSGLGDAAREFVACLRAAGIDVAEIDNDTGLSPEQRQPRPLPDRRYDTTVAFHTALEFPVLRDRFPELFGPGQRMIGYWFWELEHVPAVHVELMSLVDEVWTASTFVRDAYEAVADPTTRVRLAPLRLPEPDDPAAETAAWRERFGKRFVFLVSFDYLSFPERKNPGAAVRAFLEAFAGVDDVALVVKSINRGSRPDTAEAIETQSGGDDRIWFIDEHLSERRHHGLIAAVDCFVSPHRSEGLGLHPALAMWLGTPVIATAYGGVLDFCDDDNSILCSYDLVPVVGGLGVYPEGAPWADIDHHELVSAMRSVRGDHDRREAMIAAARRDIDQQQGRAAFGQRYVALLAEL